MLGMPVVTCLRVLLDVLPIFYVKVNSVPTYPSCPAVTSSCPGCAVDAQEYWILWEMADAVWKKCAQMMLQLLFSPQLVALENSDIISTSPSYLLVLPEKYGAVLQDMQRGDCR